MGIDRRAALLDATERVIGERGAAATTIADLTTAAGVAKGTFYLYFDSKEAVLAAVQERWIDHLIARTAATYERLADSDFWTQIDAFLADIVDLDLEHRSWHRATVSLGESPAQARRMQELIAAGIQAGIDAGACHTEDVEAMASMLYAACKQLTHEVMLSEGPVDRDRLLRATRELVHKALALPDGAAPRRAANGRAEAARAVAPARGAAAG
jgi:AcrR family transcriptional regulator